MTSLIFELWLRECFTVCVWVVLGETCQQSTGAIGEENQAMGKSRGGNTTKIHMAVDACGFPIEFDLTGGEVHDCKAAPELITKLPHAEYIIADKGYDSEELRYLIRTKSSIPMIPRKSNSTIGNADMDWCLYKYRHLVENVFARLKHFRSIHTVIGLRGIRSLKGSTIMPSYVYILSNQRNGTLYVGSTSDLIKRVWEHKSNVIPSSFTAQYNVHILCLL